MVSFVNGSTLVNIIAGSVAKGNIIVVSTKLIMKQAYHALLLSAQHVCGGHHPLHMHGTCIII